MRITGENKFYFFNLQPKKIFYWLTDPCHYSYVGLWQTKNYLRIDSVKLLGNHIDDQFNFNQHISNIYKSCQEKFNTLVRLKCFLGFEERKVLINSLIFYCNYCPVWSILSAKSLDKVENLQKRALWNLQYQS